MSDTKVRSRKRRKAGCTRMQPAAVSTYRMNGYWMTVDGAAKGCTGATAVTFCQTAPAALVANDLLPVEVKLVGIAVA